MQIESLSKERLEELRELFKTETDPEKKRKIALEGKAIKVYLENPKWGSKEVGGNSLCYTCHEQEARVGHYNCLDCAGDEKVNYEARSIQGMQQALLEWAKDKELKRKTSTVEDVMNIFEIR